MNLLVLIKTSRPLFWIIPSLVFLISLVASGSSLSTISVIQLILFSFPYSFFLFGINSVYDYESDKQNRTRNSFFRGIYLEKQHHSAVLKLGFLFASIILLTSFLTLNLFNIVSISLLLLLSYAYSSPPLRLKERPPLDSISNAVVFLLIWFTGASYGMSFMDIPVVMYFVALVPFAGHVLGTTYDYTADKKAGHKTFSTVFGKRVAGTTATLALLIVYFFGDIQSMLLRGALLFSSILIALSAAINKERYYSKFFFVILLTFILTAVLFAYQQFYKSGFVLG